MPELRVPSLPTVQGYRISRVDYRRDFRERDARVRNRDSWKLERRQHFEEPGNASWAALCAGDWDEAVRLLRTAERRAALKAVVQEDEDRGSSFHRVRVVQKPLTAYMQWELTSQQVRAECGELIRVIDVERIAASEPGGRLLPEIVILGGATLYQVRYTDAGVPDGAIRYTDRLLIERWEDYIKALYQAGDDVRSYVEREVTPLPPPRIHEVMEGTREREGTCVSESGAGHR